MIRVVVVDDHPALRAGLDTVLRSEPGMVPVGAADSAAALWPLLQRTKPDVVLLDYHLPSEDGLQVCRRIKSEVLAPRVLLYTAYAGSELAIPAVLAGADGVIGKGIPALDLFEAIRIAARGERVLPPIPRELLEAAGARIDPEDLPVLGMLLEHTPVADIEAVLGLERRTLMGRVDRMIAQLRFEVPEVRTR